MGQHKDYGKLRPEMMQHMKRAGYKMIHSAGKSAPKGSSTGSKPAKSKGK